MEYTMVGDQVADDDHQEEARRRLLRQMVNAVHHSLQELR